MIRTAVIYVLVNSLVLTFERTLSATLLLGLEVASYLLNHDQRSPSGSFFVAERVGLNMKYFCKFNFFHINFEEIE